MNAALAGTAAPANISVNEQLIATESIVAQATSHLDLMRTFVDQAHIPANEASQPEQPRTK